MHKWPYKVESWSMPEILEATKSEHWQKFRKSLKGLSTRQKLLLLEEYQMCQEGMSDEDVELRLIRVDNYINALKRGGQLNMQLEVQR